MGKYGFDVLVDEPFSKDVAVRCLGPAVENVAVRGKRSEICGGAFQLTGGIVNYKHFILRYFKHDESRPSQSEGTQFQSESQFTQRHFFVSMAEPEDYTTWSIRN